MLKTWAISEGLVVVFTPWETILGTVDISFFIVIIDLTPFNVVVFLV